MSEIGRPSCINCNYLDRDVMQCGRSFARGKSVCAVYLSGGNPEQIRLKYLELTDCIDYTPTETYTPEYEVREARLEYFRKGSDDEQ